MILEKPVRTAKERRRWLRTRRPPGTKRREAKAANSIDPDSWQAVVLFYGGRCAICETEPWREQGHAKAIARGGTHTIGNVYPVCRRCNREIGMSTVWPRRRHQWMPPEGSEP